MIPSSVAIRRSLENSAKAWRGGGGQRGLRMYRHWGSNKTGLFLLVIKSIWMFGEKETAERGTKDLGKKIKTHTKTYKHIHG